jgi:tetratricopeptide (TPR) repeat protein
VSYTELEFQSAAEAGLPQLVFLLDEDAVVPIPPGKLLDSDPGLQAQQRVFRARVLECGVTAVKFSSPEQLELLLFQALKESRPRGEPQAAEGRAGLPPRPDLVGRDGEVAALVESWLDTPSQPVAVLGTPGIGKSTICLAALHDGRVAERFRDRRWFVRCDGAASAAALLSRLAAELGVPGGEVPGGITGRVCAVLGADLGVVVLDNFETPWTADPLPVEELLRMIGGIPQARVAITSRGTGRPAGLRWRDFAMVSPLPLDQARRMFLAVAGPALAGDSRLDELLAGLDGVPLAVELMAYAAQGQPDLAEVAQRWQGERTGMLSRMGGARRELSVAASIETSVTGSQMTAPAHRLLALLGVLPDGIDREDLAVLLPGSGLGAAAVLRQHGLAFNEGTRLRTLAPIREHVAAAHRSRPEDLARASSHYARLAATGAQLGWGIGTQAAARLQAETGNIAAMLRQAAVGQQIDELLAGVSGLGKYWELTGDAQPSPDLLAATEKAVKERGSPWQQANAQLVLGNLAMSRSDYLEARARYELAVALYRQEGDMLWEAHSIGGLGDVALASSDHDEAQAWYEQTLQLYRQVEDLRGEANCITRLGDIAVDRSDFAAARDRYEQALQLYRQVEDEWGEELLGQANCTKRLGDVALARSHHDQAQAWYEQALTFYQQVGAALNEAQCIALLGDIAVDRSDFTAARDRYEQALSLYRAIPESYLAGWMLVRLARLDPSGDDRARHWAAASQAWASIGRNDLIESIQAEFH